MPQVESSYVSFEQHMYKKMNLDQIIAGTATVITISCIIGYFVYLSFK